MIRMVWMKLIKGKEVAFNIWRVRIQQVRDELAEMHREKDTRSISFRKYRQKNQESPHSLVPALTFQSPSRILTMRGTGSFHEWNPWGSPLCLLAKDFNRFPTKKSTELARFSFFHFSFKRPGANLENCEIACCSSSTIFRSLQISECFLCPLHGTRQGELMTKPVRSSWALCQRLLLFTST